MWKPISIDQYVKIHLNKNLNDRDAAGYNGYIAAEFTYPVLPPHEGGAVWFCSLPVHDNLCLLPEKIYSDYPGAVKFGNIFSLNVGPAYAGRIRNIDVKTLKTGGRIHPEKLLSS